MSIYDYQGNIINRNVSVLDYDKTVKAIAHRGYSSIAPENTLPAYKLAKQNGFSYAETDISFTSDGVAVCLHDATIDRTSDGTGNIGSLTFAQVREYDFGSWKSSAYAGTLIPSFEEFILLCRNIGLHPYIELKNNGGYTQAQIESLVDVVEEYGMKGKVSWISFSSSYLTYVKNYDSDARLGFVVSGLSSGNITTAQGLQTSSNEVFIDTSAVTDEAATLCINGGLPMEVWTVDSVNTIQSMNPYITGVTSNSLIAGQILYDANIT